MQDRAYVSLLIQQRARAADIEFSIIERGPEWFVYGFDVSTCIPSRMQTTWVLIAPPDTTYPMWHWSNCGDAAAPSKKEARFFDHICNVFGRYGSLASCSERSQEVLDNNSGLWL